MIFQTLLIVLFATYKEYPKQLFYSNPTAKNSRKYTLSYKGMHNCTSWFKTTFTDFVRSQSYCATTDEATPVTWQTPYLTDKFPHDMFSFKKFPSMTTALVTTSPTRKYATVQVGNWVGIFWWNCPQGWVAPRKEPSPGVSCLRTCYNHNRNGCSHCIVTVAAIYMQVAMVKT